MLERARTRVHGKLLMPAAYYIMGDRRFTRLEQFIQRDGWTRSQIEEHQAKRLSSLLRVGWDHNPYWREKFRRFDVRPNRGDPFAEVRKLPILTKDELRANWRRMKSTHLSDNQVVHETSSGSTGMPINVYQSRYYRWVDAAMAYRGRLWMGVDLGEPAVSVVADRAFMSAKKRVLRQLRLLVERGMVIDAFVFDPELVEARIRRANRFRPALISGYTTSVVTAAKIAKGMGLDWKCVRAVSTTAECLFDHDRKILEEAFGAPVYDQYGSREVTGIAMQCVEGSHHIFADSNYVEFTPVAGSGNGTNAIVLTPLDNEAMPLFRYRNGDCASPVDGTCSGGKAFPLMTRCHGRICNNFLLSDGRIINGTYFLYYFYYQEGFTAYQYHQTAVDHIDLYVVPDGVLSDDRRSYLQRSCTEMEQSFGNQFRMDLHVVGDVPHRAGGKHLYTISDCLKNV